MTIISLAARRNATIRSVAEPTISGAPGMSTAERDGVAVEAPALEALLASAPAPIAGPVRVHGKFFFAGEAKHFVRGVTYGPFATGTHGAPFPERAVVVRDFAL